MLTVKNTYKLFLILTLLCVSSFSPICAQVRSNTLTSDELTTLTGEIITLDKLEGKYVVVNLWGTWCRTCIKEIPQLNELKDSFSDRDDIVFLAVTFSAMDDNKKIKKFLKRRKFNFIHLHPYMDTKFFNFEGNVSFPTTVVYDPEKKLIFSKTLELNANDMQELRDKLKIANQ